MNDQLKMVTKHINFYYGDFQALSDICLEFNKNQVTALIGPSGCGKSTFLRCLNRMNDLIPGIRIEGEIFLDGQDIYDQAIDVVALRRQVGMVFQKPNPFPKTIFENVAYGLRVDGTKDRSFIAERVERSLRQAALWDEVKDRLDSSALGLSGGQQQRLCIARALAVEPEVLLMDEPASALDPIATQKIEDLIHQLKENYTAAGKEPIFDALKFTISPGGAKRPLSEIGSLTARWVRRLPATITAPSWPGELGSNILMMSGILGLASS